MADQHPDSDVPTRSLPGAPEVLTRVRVHSWAVEVVGGPDAGRRVQTQDDLVRVGTDPSNDLVLGDATVSRRHLELERSARGLLVRDLGSRNGTLLEGRSVLQAWLQPGDRVALGQTLLALRLECGGAGSELELSGARSFGRLDGASERMRRVFAELRRAAREELSLLIEGETGTGKELAARAVHQHSVRRHGPFRVLDCALLPPAAERELYGEQARAGGAPAAGEHAAGEQAAGEHVAGEHAAGEHAFVGALEAARGGTLLLDEVGEVPLALQARLVRALEARELPGAAAPVDLRLIATTQKNLEEEVRQGRFRADLYFRLAGLRVRLPPLRSRKEDLPLLARALLGPGAAGPAPELLALLEAHDWPGNVRELRNVLERGPVAEALPGGAQALLGPAAHEDSPALASTRAPELCKLPYHEARDRVLAQFERHYFAQVMKEACFDMQRAEERTELSMQSLYRLLKKNGLRLKDLKNPGELDR